MNYNPFSEQNIFEQKGDFIMNKNTNSFLKGMGAGVIAGAAMITAGKMMLNNKNTKRAVSKGTSKAFRAMGDFVEGVQTLMK